MSDQEIATEIGRQLRQRRKQLKLTLAVASARASITLGYLSGVELGIYHASISTLNGLCTALGLTLCELFAFTRDVERLEREWEV